MKPRIGTATLSVITLLAWSVIAPPPAPAQPPVQGEILQQDLQNGQGVTVVHVWGSHHDMGYAHGVLMADWVQLAYTEMRATFGALWPTIRARVAGYTFLPAAAGDEFQGILDGVRAIHPESTMDLTDLKACCTFGDWAYSIACRSTSCWGEWVDPPYTTLSARKLQFMNLPSQITQQWHHVICAWEPNDGTPAWVNFGFPGYASSVTGLNEFGTIASLHDWNSNVGTLWSNALPRTMACRWILTMDNLGPDPMTHLQTAFDALRPYHVATGGFINYYVPGGGAGVIKTSRNAGFYDVRRPRPEYMNGESISTNNSDIDGTYGIDPWAPYYQTLAPPTTRATMDGLWQAAYQSTDMHIVEVGFRGSRDMTVWFAGREQSGMGDRVEWEWTDLFRNPAGVDFPEISAWSATAPPFPNPARGTSRVTITFPSAGLQSTTAQPPRVAVLDVSGRLIRILTAPAAPAWAPASGPTSGPGEITFHWDGRDNNGSPVASGAYALRPMDSPGEAKKIVWIR